MLGVVAERLIKIFLMASIALWGLIGSVANLAAYSDGYASVARVLSMSGTTGAPAMWRAVESEFFAHIGFAYIWCSKLLTGVLCSISVVSLWLNRRRTASAFHTAKSLGVTGACVSMLMLFFGFIVVSGSFFELWRDAELGPPAHEYASIYLTCIGVIVLVILQAETEQQ